MNNTYPDMLDISVLSEESKKEIISRYQLLLQKQNSTEKKKFSAIQITTKGWKFNREEANAR